jgi:nucleotide-binding universal stress UspA family protein
VTRFRVVLVPVDFSEHSAAALDVAIGLVGGQGGTLHLLHAYEVPLGAVPPYGVALPESLLAQVRDAAARRLEKAAHRVEGAGIALETHLAHGPAAEAISEAAERLGVDLIVMGTRGLTGIKHVLLGSVAERTVRQAPCPVLTVRAAGRAPD